MKNISIIIPVLNEEKYIIKILKNIKEQNIKPFEIIIVDSQSIDKTKEKSLSIIPEINYIYSKKPGPAEQRNYGAKNANGDIFVFFDADIEIPKDFIQKIQKYYSNKLNINNSIFPFYIPKTYNPLLIIIFLIQNIIFILTQYFKPFLAGPCMVIPKNIFLNIGGFKNDKRFEDLYIAKEISKNNKIRGPVSYILLSTRRFKNIFSFIYTSILYIFILVLAFLNIHPPKKYIHYKFNNKNKLY